MNASRAAAGDRIVSSHGYKEIRHVAGRTPMHGYGYNPFFEKFTGSERRASSPQFPTALCPAHPRLSVFVYPTTFPNYKSLFRQLIFSGRVFVQTSYRVALANHDCRRTRVYMSWCSFRIVAIVVQTT